MDRTAIVEANFRRRTAARDLPDGRAPSQSLSHTGAVALFRAQCLSRALDLESRAMQAAGQGFYTIGSSGHEGMAAVAHALRPTDPAFLHYRDAAFQIARAGQVPGQTPAWDMALSFACSADDPISGGRHKVLGSKALNIPPQTSTIASHLPKALGAAWSIGLARRARPEHAAYAPDALAMCSFGDASLNHSTAQGALNSAGWTAHQSSPLPLLFVCEDNGIGISVKSPRGWVEASLRARPGLRYVSGDGLDIYDTHRAASTAADFVRTCRKPAILHLRCVRLYGHAGPDVATAYLSRAEVEADEANDPLLHSVRLLHQAGALDPDAALAIYDDTRARVTRICAQAVQRPRLRTAEDVMASLIPPKRPCTPRQPPAPTPGEPQTMGKLITQTLHEQMALHPEIALMGEDVGRKGGVYGITQKLQQSFGPARVIDTLLDEQTILGLAIGLAQNGFLPIPEIQFLAYLHNAEDQLRGEAATLPFFSGGQFTNPMVVRIAGLGYQKGFGGHFHNDNSLAVLRDIPGLILACPSRAADAAGMLRECIRLAREEQRLVVFLEPIALYHERDMEPGDGRWMDSFAPGTVPLGQVGVHGDGPLGIVTFGNGVRLSRMAADRMGGGARVIDLRWLAPLPDASLLAALDGCERVVVVDETRRSGGVSESVVTLLATHGIPVTRHAAQDSFIATGPAFGATMPSVDSIVEACQ